MDLCGWELPTLLGVLALVVFVVLLTGWPKQRSGWWVLPARASLLVALNVLVLAIAAALLNNQYAFYASWSDLFDTSDSASVQHYGGEVTEASVTLPWSGPQPSASPSAPIRAKARQHQYRVVGARSHFTNDVIVRLPEHYDPHSAQQYPVILALHGYPGNPKAFARIDGFYDGLDRAARTKLMASAIVVMPQINYPRTLDTECVDIPGGPQAETWLAQDVPQWVMEHFAARADRRAWVTYGYSFGGWCAAMLSMRHPGTFGGAVVLQGYFRPEFEEPVRGFTPGSAEYRKYDLVALARRNPPPLAMWVLASKPDRISYPTTKEFIAAARAPMSVTADLPVHGGHNNSVWEGKNLQIFTWLGRTLPGFHA